tara:strand:- start:8604 stop:9182 length:579 start_codon:yes stop_codon:yes gene_type:complete
VSSFYTPDELKTLGFKSFGKKVLISRNASLYGIEKIEIGDNVRVDDFCILSGKIKLGSHIHISAGTYLFSGDAGIEMQNFSGLSPRCTVFAISDDFSGQFMIGPLVDDIYRSLSSAKVTFKKHTQIGSGSIILPGVIIEEGSIVGAKSLVIKSTEKFGIYVGTPAKRIKSRCEDLLVLETQFLKKLGKENDI